MLAGRWTFSHYTQTERGQLLRVYTLTPERNLFDKLWHRALVRYVQLWGRLEWGRFKRGMGLRDDRRRSSFYGTYAYREWGKNWNTAGLTGLILGRTYPSIRRLPDQGVLTCRALARANARKPEDAA